MTAEQIAIQVRPRTAVYLAVVLITALAAYAGHMIGIQAIALASCGPKPPPGYFFAVCGMPGFGFYEHGAYALDLEPESVAALKRADVLILGASTSAIGFSTEATHAFFSKEGLRSYNLSFGYGEGLLFEDRLINEFSIRPKVFIINADPFFHVYESVVGRMANYSDPNGLLYYVSRKISLKLYPFLCIYDGCTTRATFVYRSAETGDWDWRYHLNDPTLGSVIVNDDALVAQESAINDGIVRARLFVAQHPMPAECIILTGTPSNAPWYSKYPPPIARALGFSLVMPDVRGLKTMDGTHLNGDSADRWSAAFFVQAKPIIERCTKTGIARLP